MPRETADVDCVSISPIEESSILQEHGGIGSALHKKYGVYLQHVGISTLPEDYADRLTPMFPGAYDRLQLFGVDPYDLALSKLERNLARDRADVKFLGRKVPLDLRVLESRYRTEMRPYLANEERHDLTFRLWLEMLQNP